MALRYLPAIDGLRAVAVLSVLAYHAGLGGSGYVGVDVFFVISGYLITRLLKEDGDLVAFYARRARRILPAAILVVLATLALSALLLPDSGDVARSASAAAVFGANFWFQHATSDYWSSSAEQMPLLHLWSLSVEEQFYLLWPFLLLLKRRWMVVVFLASLALYAYLSWANPSAAFYQMPARAWELAAGGLVALVDRNAATAIRAMFPVLGVALVHDDRFAGIAHGDDLVAAARIYDTSGGPTTIGNLASHPFRQQLHSEPRISEQIAQTAEVAGHDQADTVDDHERQPDSEGKNLQHGQKRPAHHESERHGHGKQQRNPDELSHHFPRARLVCPTIIRKFAVSILQHGSHIGLALIAAAILAPLPVWGAQSVAVLGATLVVACPHSKLLEAKPMVWVGLISYSLYLWHWPLLALDRALRVGESPLTVRLALCGVAVILATLTYRYVETPFRKARVRPVRAIALGLVSVAALSCTAFVMADTRPAVVVPVSGVSQCRPGSTLQPMKCVGAGPKVVLWGDSFAGAWANYAESLATQKGVPAVRAIVTSCPPVIGVEVPRPTPKASQFCRRKAEETLAYLQANGADTLIVAGHWARMLRERPEAGAKVVEEIRALPNVDRILIVGATPEVKDSVEKCIALGLSCDITREEYERSASATKRMTRELATLPNVEVLELGDWMCDADKCRGVRNGLKLYRHDNHHASDEAVAEFLRR